MGKVKLTFTTILGSRTKQWLPTTQRPARRASKSVPPTSTTWPTAIPDLTSRQYSKMPRKASSRPTTRPKFKTRPSSLFVTTTTTTTATTSTSPRARAVPISRTLTDFACRCLATTLTANHFEMAKMPRTLDALASLRLNL